MNKTNATKELGLHKWLRETAVVRFSMFNVCIQNIRPVLRCNDGVSLSVQASSDHYCSPRVNYLAMVDHTGNEIQRYKSLEVWHVTSEVPESWNEYGSKDDPYAFIPVELVQEFIDLHGGIDWIASS